MVVRCACVAGEVCAVTGPVLPGARAAGVCVPSLCLGLVYRSSPPPLPCPPCWRVRCTVLTAPAASPYVQLYERRFYIPIGLLANIKLAPVCTQCHTEVTVYQVPFATHEHMPRLAV